jgi:group I intron endonuclease
MKCGIIYCYINKINHKCYVGQTTRPKRRFEQHIYCSKNPGKNRFHRAINKYGIDNFHYIILKAVSLSNDENYRSYMDELESKYIIEFNSRNSGYNATDGGGNV